jgi:hypothetical protein
MPSASSTGSTGTAVAPATHDAEERDGPIGVVARADSDAISMPVTPTAARRAATASAPDLTSANVDSRQPLGRRHLQMRAQRSWR